MVTVNPRHIYTDKTNPITECSSTTNSVTYLEAMTVRKSIPFHVISANIVMSGFLQFYFEVFWNIKKIKK